MRAIIGWTFALAASALLGVVVYQAVLSDPPGQPISESLVEQPSPVPTPTRTIEVEDVVVDPTPTVTQQELVAVAAGSAQAGTAATSTGPGRAARRHEARETENSDERAESAKSDDSTGHEASKDEHESDNGRDD
jgi:hypothetical protein